VLWTILGRKFVVGALGSWLLFGRLGGREHAEGYRWEEVGVVTLLIVVCHNIINYK
jgi:hypothetical protein